MKVKWLGHASFLIESNNGIKVVTDPYDTKAYTGAILHAPISLQADYVTISHQHGDHNYADGVKGAKVVDRAGTHSFDGVRFLGIRSFHDDKGGRERGTNIVFKMEFPDYAVVHCGDLGTELTDEQIRELGKVDVLLIPVGGTYTIDGRAAAEIIERINPQITIPMHFATPKIRFPIAPVDDFLKFISDYKRLSSSELVVEEALKEGHKVYVLEPAL